MQFVNLKPFSGDAMHRFSVFVFSIFLISAAFVSGALSAKDLNVQETLIHVTDNGDQGLNLICNLSQSENISLLESNLPVTMIQTENGRDIPVMQRFIAMPNGFMPKVRLVDRTSFRIAPNSVSPDAQSSQIDNSHISQLELEPEVPATVRHIGYFRGIPVAALSIYPVQLEAGGDGMIENRSLEIEINYTPDPSIRSARPAHDRIGSDMSRFMDNMFLNSPNRDQDYVENQQEYRGRILILHPDNQQFDNQGLEHVQNLAGWKTSMGYQVEIVAVNIDPQQGGLAPEEIKNDLIVPRYEDEENPLEYLILIGADPTEGGNIQFPSFRHEAEGENYQSDHFYSTLDEGDEYISDISAGRINVNGYEQLESVIDRTILYEREPFVDDLRWYDRVLYTAENISAPGGQFVPSMADLGAWLNVQLTDFGYRLNILYAPENDADIHVRVQQLFEEGLSMAFSRGWIQGCADWEDPQEYAVTGRKNPFTMAITCLSYTTQKYFYRSAEHRQFNGPIAAIANNGLSHSKSNNSLMGGAVLAVTDMGLSNTGLIYDFSKLQFISDNRFELAEWAIENISVCRLIGDPSTQIYTHRPLELEVDHPETITPGTRGLSVEVSRDGETAAGAWVTLEQEDGLHLVCQPGDDGFARFSFEEDQLMAGNLYLTITGKNSIPYINVISVQEADRMIDLTNIEFDAPDGMMGDVPVTAAFRNSGNQNLNNLVVNLSAEDLLTGFSSEQIQLGALARNAEREIQFDVQFDGASRSGRIVRIQMEAANGQESWEHAYQIETSGHNLKVIGNPVLNNDFEPGQIANFRPRLNNSGDFASPRMNVTLESLSSYVNVVGNQVRYPSIDPGDSEDPEQNGFFRVEAEDLAISGNIAKFRLTMDAVDGADDFTDIIYFESIIGDPNVSDPYGPDNYGYIAFDSFDRDWEKCPEYNWIEINPDEENAAFNGEKLEFEDFDVNLDSSITIPLPFSFRFYGESFDTIAVCSNGWIAFGADKGVFDDFRNQQIPGIQGPDAQVAVFWQDLINPIPQHRGCYYHYDEERGILVIEWSKYKIYRDENADPNQHLVEFQLLLYDPRRYPTSTGDGEIKMQYKSVFIQEGDLWDNHYTTVGLKNLDGSDGLEYSYWNQFPPANQQLQDELAILFTTDRITQNGRLVGRITYREDDQRGIEGATVTSLNTGASANTDATGGFVIDPIPVTQHRIEIAKPGFNSLIAEITIEPDEVARLDTSLTHPVLSASSDARDYELRPGPYGVSFNYEIGNEGNGPLEYHFQRRYIDGTATAYERIYGRNFSSQIDDNNLNGCQFVGDSVFVSGKGLRDVNDDQFIYVFDSQGEYVRRFAQPAQTDDGFQDLAWDGNLLYGGESRRINNENINTIVAFNASGEAVNTIQLEISTEDLAKPKALAYNPNTNQLIVGNGSDDLFIVSMDGQVVDHFPINVPGVELDIRGFAWHQGDNDGMNLYVVDQPGIDGGVRLIKVDIETGISKFVQRLDLFNRNYPFGLTIGYDWEQSIVSMGMIMSGGGRRDNDSLRVYEIGPDTHFLTMEPDQGIVEAGETEQIGIEMRGEDLTEGRYEFGLVLKHNAEADSALIPITLTVDRNTDIADNSTVPLTFALDDAYPNPFNGHTRIGFSLDQTSFTKLTVYDVSGREVKTLVEKHLKAGGYQFDFKPRNLTSGMYLYKLESAGNSKVKRLLYLR